MQMLTARLRAQLGLLTAATVLAIAISIVMAGTFEKPNYRIGLPGSPALTFRLPDINGKILLSSSLRGQVTVLCFASGLGSNEPSDQMTRLAQLAAQYGPTSGVKVVSIRSNTEDLTPEQMHTLQSQAEMAGDCTTLLDPTGYVARMYRIDQLPTFVIIDSAGTIRYRGGIDDPSPDAPVTAISFPNLVDLLLAERPESSQSTPAVLSKIK
jgi:hypothetical protein